MFTGASSSCAERLKLRGSGPLQGTLYTWPLRRGLLLLSGKLSIIWILGLITRIMLDADFIAKVKQQLLDDKARLEEELAGLSPHIELGTDEEATAAELPLDEVNQDLISHIKADLEKIDKALSKIEVGTYGVDDSGKEFSQKQLEANPYAEVALDVE